MAEEDIEFKKNDNPKIRSDYKPSEKHEELLRKGYSRFHDMKMARASEEPKWNKWEKQYEGWKPPRGVDDWHSNFVPPYTTAIVESELAELIDQTIRPTVTAATNEDKPKAAVMNFIEQYIWDNTSADLELYKAIKDSLIFGTSIIQEYYLYEEREVMVVTEFDPSTGVEKFEKKKIVDFDNIYFETVKLQDFYIDPDARSINTGTYKANDCIRRYIMHIDTFKRIFSGPIWNPFDAAKHVRAGGDTNYYEFYKPPEEVNKGKHIEVLFWWVRHPDKFIVLANDVIVRDGPNPYNHKQLPFASAPDIMRGHSFYHKGEPELLESIQDELTLLRRMRMDRQHIIINPMWKVSKSADISENDFIVAPNKPIFMGDIEKDMAELTMSDTPISSYREEELIKEDGTRVTGVDPELQSVQAAESATQSAILKEATLKRLKLKIWLLTRTLLYELMLLRIPNITQFYSEPTIEKIIGDKNTKKYISRVAESIIDGRLLNEGGELKEKRFREIRTINKKLLFQKDGEVKVEEKRGENFFMVRPEMLVPTAKQGFDFRIKSEPTFPVSKPLLQQKVNELFQTPLIQAGIQSGIISLQKSIKQVLEINDFDEEDFLEESTQEEAGAIVDPTILIELASRENELLTQGEEVKGTAYSTPEHTQLHVDYMNSETFKEKLSEMEHEQRVAVIKNFSKHILLEESLQKKRAAALGAQVQPPVGVDPQQQQGVGSQPRSPGEGVGQAIPGRVTGNDLVGNFSGIGQP